MAESTISKEFKSNKPIGNPIENNIDEKAISDSIVSIAEQGKIIAQQTSLLSKINSQFINAELITGINESEISIPAMLFTLIISCLIGILSGIAPAHYAARGTPISSLRRE